MTTLEKSRELAIAELSDADGFVVCTYHDDLGCKVVSAVFASHALEVVRALADTAAVTIGDVINAPEPIVLHKQVTP